MVTDDPHQDSRRELFRVLSIDGGGSKGMFSVGVLLEAEDTWGKPCGEVFDLVYGTSVGSIIAALIATGQTAKQIHILFSNDIPRIMRCKTAKGRSRALRNAVDRMFGSQKFTGLNTLIGIVATRLDHERPMIFKTSASQAIKGQQSFVPGWDATIADAIMASCAAQPIFKSVSVSTIQGNVETIDGGFVANNPNLFALVDAVHTLGNPANQVAILSVGVGSYPRKRTFNIQNLIIGVENLICQHGSTQLLETSLAANAFAMQGLTDILFEDAHRIRIDPHYSKAHYATSMIESDPDTLQLLVRSGRDEFRERAQKITDTLQIN